MPKKAAKEKRASLLDGDELSHQLQAALEATFARFDCDGDGALSTDELQAFARCCNDGEGFDEEELKELRFFHVNEAGNLTLKGFLQMYHTQTVARPRDTWQDLKALGFDATLTVSEDMAARARAAVAAAAAASPPPASATPAAAVASGTVAEHCAR